jgi:phosphomethylpyrimidine synthase
MRITQDVRAYAEEHGLDPDSEAWTAIELGMKEKAAEFVDGGAEVYGDGSPPAWAPHSRR